MELKKRSNKKAIYFTLDAILGVTLIIGLYILSNTYYVKETEKASTNHISFDLTSSFSNILISEVNNAYVQDLIATGKINNTNNTIIEQIAEFYVLNQTDLAYNLTKNISQELIPSQYGFEFTVNNEVLYSNEKPIVGSLSTSKRLISGIEKFKPIRGSASKVYLQGILKKKVYSYLYYGGFIGQGNVTQYTENLPSDAEIVDAFLELDVASNFTLKINDVICDEPSNPFAPNLNRAEQEPTVWNITGCIDLLDPDIRNKISINFRNNFTQINQSYIAGGFLRIGYTTKEISKNNTNILRYEFPAINGVVNLYDSFYVPGTIDNMSIYLKFKSNASTYLMIANKEIYTTPKGNDTDQIWTISDNYLRTNVFYSGYDEYSNKTVPVRFASYDAMVQSVQGGNADIVLITDLSASMKNALDNDFSNGNPGGCDDVFTDPKTRKDDLAYCLDYEFINITMNFTGNRMRIITIFDDDIDICDANNKQEAFDCLLSRQGKGKTPIASAINAGYDWFSIVNSSTRQRFMLLMSDGVPTHCAGASCPGTLTSILSTDSCIGYCDTPGGGACHVNPLPPASSDYIECGLTDSVCDEPIANAIWSAQRVHDGFNATIYTVGIGSTVLNCDKANYTLAEIARVGDGTYNKSAQPGDLLLIYQAIAYDILTRVDQGLQTVNIRTSDLMNSTLYEGFIEINYTPMVEPAKYGEIEITTEVDLQDCNSQVEIPVDVRVIDSKITSYSGIHWSETLKTNDQEDFNLTTYSENYVKMGDPFIIQVLPMHLSNSNYLNLTVADTRYNLSNCSKNNSFIYTALVKSSVSYSEVLEKIDGCNWTVEYDDFQIGQFRVPPDYLGSKECNYTNNSIWYDLNDTYDDAIYRLFDQLDFNNDGRIFVNLDQNNLIINTILVSKVPYPWGPSIAEVRLWE